MMIYTLICLVVLVAFSFSYAKYNKAKAEKEHEKALRFKDAVRQNEETIEVQSELKKTNQDIDSAFDSDITNGLHEYDRANSNHKK